MGESCKACISPTSSTGGDGGISARWQKCLLFNGSLSLPSLVWVSMRATYLGLSPLFLSGFRIMSSGTWWIWRNMVIVGIAWRELSGAS